MKNNAPIIKRGIANDKMDFQWRYGGDSTNVILENADLNVKILRYLVLSEDNRFLYDTISIRESINNTVIVIRNQKKE